MSFMKNLTKKFDELQTQYGGPAAQLAGKVALTGKLPKPVEQPQPQYGQQNPTYGVPQHGVPEQANGLSSNPYVAPQPSPYQQPNPATTQPYGQPAENHGYSQQNPAPNPTATQSHGQLAENNGYWQQNPSTGHSPGPGLRGYVAPPPAPQLPPGWISQIR